MMILGKLDSSLNQESLRKVPIDLMNKPNSFKPQKPESKVLKNYFSEAKLLQTPEHYMKDKAKLVSQVIENYVRTFKNEESSLEKKKSAATNRQPLLKSNDLKYSGGSQS